MATVSKKRMSKVVSKWSSKSGRMKVLVNMRTKRQRAAGQSSKRIGGKVRWRIKVGARDGT